MADDFTKVVMLGNAGVGSIFAKVTFRDGKLSISGVEGPMSNGDAKGSFGQIIMSYKEYDHRGHLTLREIRPAGKWTHELIRQFFDVWDRWHLNDMKGGSPAQEEWLRANPVVAVYPESHYTKASEALAQAGLNPDADGYRYGHAWKREEVPAEVIAFLKSLPDSPVTPAWV
jgi:hypothetical protein